MNAALNLMLWMLIHSRLELAKTFDINSVMIDCPEEQEPIRVLVIEDNPDDRKLLLRQLRKHGIDGNVKFISDGQEALDFLLNPRTGQVPETLIAIFIDIKLPSMNGLEMLRQVRASSKFTTILFIVMTSSNNPKHLEKCKRLGVASYVSKPVSYSDFSKAVANIFHSPKSDQQPESKYIIS